MSEKASLKPARSKESTAHVLLVTVLLCLICSVLVTTAAVVLRPMQEYNKALDRKKNILRAAGLLEEGKDIDELFKQIELKVVDLDTGKYIEHINAEDYDLDQALKDPQSSSPVRARVDIARIGRRENYGRIGLVEKNGQIESIILPIRGAGLYSTLHGFIALDRDGTTVRGLSFHEQGETPGLGGEIENSRWLAKWSGKRIYDDDGAVRIDVIKGAVPAGKPEAVHQIDGISGATLTSRGVSNLVRFWFSDAGYKTLLTRIAKPVD